MSWRTPEEFAHLEWLGFVQPVGLVVSLPALSAAQAIVSREVIPLQDRLKTLVRYDPEQPNVHVKSLAEFVVDLLGWQQGELQFTKGVSHGISAPSIFINSYNETLQPTYVVAEPEPDDEQQPWMMLVKELAADVELDRLDSETTSSWQATPQMKFERLLRESKVFVGLITNGRDIRLVYAPSGESSGYVTFKISDMCTVAGRPILAAFHMLLSSERLFLLPKKRRLVSILIESRKHQSTVSTELSQQVLGALHELVRGFQAADDHVHGAILGDVLERDPDYVYAGLLTVLMRLVFVLYAEDRNLLPVGDRIYSDNYSVTGLFDRLREDDGRYPDSMDRRYGAWAQLLTLFRLIHSGGFHRSMIIQARKGYLFDPERYLFLEGGPSRTVPNVSDKTVYRILDSLLILKGERLSYRALDVQEIGSVYEAMMGFTVQKATGPSLAVKQKNRKKGGASYTFDFEHLLSLSAAERAKSLKEKTGQELTGEALADFKKAKSVADLSAALEKKIDTAGTPNIVPSGGLVLQPSDARRKSGSHYTPRSLTKPIVEKTLEPILSRLGNNPRPEDLLALKICDPAIGSGAFLVEVCRQLGAHLVTSWEHYKSTPLIPPDEDDFLHAQRLVAQRCIYGVDRNPMAVDLAKLSLWLATLAKDHTFTFIDHAIKCGDSLVGLGCKQIGAFTWANETEGAYRSSIEKKLARVREKRRTIAEAPDGDEATLRALHADAEAELGDVRLLGDAVVAAFFRGQTPKARESERSDLGHYAQGWLKGEQFAEQLRAAVFKMREGAKAVTPFHWEIEFPEVFERKRPGFDCIVGNPPFAGKTTIGDGNRDGFIDWLKTIHDESHGNSDLVAHFFRRAFNLLRADGTFGLIATNTIAQGDTRSSGLRWICKHGGTIYSAQRRCQWPGQASVVVSVVLISKGEITGPFNLDGKLTNHITAYLFHAGGDDDPSRLAANASKSFQGSIPYGMGFTFDDNDNEGIATSLKVMRDLTESNPRNGERIYPYLGGDEVNNDPQHHHCRYVIFFGAMSEDEARKWPDLMEILEEKVKPDRATKAPEVAAWPWWQFWRIRSELYDAIKSFSRALVINCGACPHMAFTFIPARTVFANTLTVFTFDKFNAFCLLQSRVHEVWTRFFASSFEDRLRYTSSDCFETFPFPDDLDGKTVIETTGKEYYELRADLMVHNKEGLTEIYNRFHDPSETSADFVKLRNLHAKMDRAILDAYGGELAKLVIPPCEFLLDYEEPDDEDEGVGRRQRKKPWRFRWPDEFRDEVLARLLELNKKRAADERSKIPASSKSAQPSLFAQQEPS